MQIIQNCPSLAEFYEAYLRKNGHKSEQELEFARFIEKYPKRFEGYAQFLFMPERKVVHKNSRFIRFDDVDMGDEVEAAIYNDNGKSAPQQLKTYVNELMDKFLFNKMNEKNLKVKQNDLKSDIKTASATINSNFQADPDSLDVSLLIKKYETMYSSSKQGSFNQLISDINTYSKFEKQRQLMHSRSQKQSHINQNSNYYQQKQRKHKSIYSVNELKVKQQFQNEEDQEALFGMSRGQKHAQSVVGLVPDINKIKGILDPKTHDNFINMVVKNQIRVREIKTTQIIKSSSTIKKNSLILNSI